MVIDPSIKELFAFIIGAINTEQYELESTFETLSESNVKELSSRHIVYIVGPNIVASGLISR